MKKKEPTETLTLRVPQSLKLQIEMAANKDDRTINSWVNKMLKDYFAEPFEVSKKQKEYYDQEVIKEQLASEYIISLTDGLSLTVLRELNNNEDFVRQNIVMLRNEDKKEE